MGQSKRYKGKTCAYCAKPESSTTNDHVVARAFFLLEDRGALPQVPACEDCNHAKSELEHYAATILMIGSRHAEADRYRAEMVRPRLETNARLSRQIGLNEPPHWISVDGMLQPMHAVVLDAGKVNSLMQLIVKGLYRHHFGEPLSLAFKAEASMYPPEGETALWASIAPLFPPQSQQIHADLGRGGFTYTAIHSSAHPGLTAWQMAWHGGVTLHGDGSPPQGVSRWWAFTRPTEEALALEEDRRHEQTPPARPAGQ